MAIPTELKPDLVEGPRRAWRCVTDRQHPAALGGWLVFGPGYHPVWAYWLISLCHLRPDPNLPPAKLKFPGAQFELVVNALDPGNAPPNPSRPLGLGNPIFLLTPADHVLQWDLGTDRQAIHLMDAFVANIVKGVLSPDQDFRGLWQSLARTYLQPMVGDAVRVAC